MEAKSSLDIGLYFIPIILSYKILFLHGRLTAVGWHMKEQHININTCTHIYLYGYTNYIYVCIHICTEIYVYM